MAKKVLVVDDEEIVRRISEMSVVRLLACEVVTAANGREALERIAEHNPDLILTDIDMPVMNGLELCKRLREDGEYRDIPIVAYSGNDNKEEALGAGANDYLAKPFMIEDLGNKLRKYLRE